MIVVCYYTGTTPQDNQMCNCCSQFLEVCVPVARKDGYSGGECDCYLCAGCGRDCIYRTHINI